MDNLSTKIHVLIFYLARSIYIKFVVLTGYHVMSIQSRQWKSFEEIANSSFLVFTNRLSSNFEHYSHICL